jgi:competence protein ComEC
MATVPLQTGNDRQAAQWPGAMAARVEAWLFGERESLLLWLPVALGGGIAAWFLLPGAMAWAGFIALALAVALAGALVGHARYVGRMLLVGGIALAAGCALIWWRSETVAAPVLERPVVTRFVATVEKTELLASRGDVRLILRPDAGAMLPPRVRVTLAMDADGATAIRAGERLSLRARLVPPPGAALPGGYDFARRAWFDRLGAVGSAIGPVERLDAAVVRGAGLRDRLSAHIQGQVAGGPGAIAAALATGDRGGISAEDDEAMRRSGLAHLLSISGLHVTAAVGGAMWLLLRLLALSPWLALRVPLVLVAAAGGALVGLGYTLLTGAEVPTIRSLVAALLVLLAIALGREAITLRLVAAGAMFVLLLWPEALIGPSFQLSFAAVTAIVALHTQPWVAALLVRREEGWLRRFGRGFVGLLLTGLAVELALMPIALFHFHKAGLYGSLANMVAIPLTTFVVMPAEALALALDSVGLGAPAWWVVDVALSGMLAVAHWVASAPGAVAALPSMPLSAFALALAGGLWLCLWQGRVRGWGLVPLFVGLGWAWSVPAPDLLITGDGRHVAARMGDGRYVLLRERAGEFVRDQLAEAAGIDGAVSGAMAGVAGLPDARCSADFCVWTMRGAGRGAGRDGGREWTVMASRSGYRTDWQPLVAACARADIVIADRWLPRGCVPRWLKADQKLLAATGGLAIMLDAPLVRSVRASGRGKPWSDPPTVLPPREVGPSTPPETAKGAGVAPAPLR